MAQVSCFFSRTPRNFGNSGDRCKGTYILPQNTSAAAAAKSAEFRGIFGNSGDRCKGTYLLPQKTPAAAAKNAEFREISEISEIDVKVHMSSLRKISAAAA